MHFCSHLAFFETGICPSVDTALQCSGLGSSWCYYHCLNKHKLGHGCSYFITSVELSTLFILCLGFSLYLKYLQRIILCFGTETDSLCREKEIETAGCQFYISKAHVYHWKYNINLIYSCRVRAKCFTRLLWAELIFQNLFVEALTSNMTVFGNKALKRKLRLNEVTRVGA